MIPATHVYEVRPGKEATHLLQGTLRVVLISLAAIFGVTVVTGLTWFCRWDPGINFLPSDRRAEWILFPPAVEAGTRAIADADTIFRRDFNLGSPPATALLRVRAAKRIQLTINDQKIEFGANHNWKDVSSAEVSSLLREGANRIEAKVLNDNGPPALWVSLDGDQLSIHSDTNWTVSCMGSAWRRAISAATPRLPGSGNPIGSGERTLTALTNVWRLWLLFSVIALSLVFATHWLISRRVINKDRMTLLVVSGFAGLWLILFWHNARLLLLNTGFDSNGHLEYIDYIQKHGSLPLPTEGWEMHQPPLYYLIAAGSLSACNLSVDDPQSIVVLRSLGAVFGIAQFVLVFLSLRLLLPPQTALVGLLLVAFLPMYLYLAHYVTNEMLSAVVATLTLYLCLRLLKSDTPRTLQFCWVGLALGAVMLSKATGILLLPIVIAELQASLLTPDRQSLSRCAISACCSSFVLLCAVGITRVSG